MADISPIFNGGVQSYKRSAKHRFFEINRRFYRKHGVGAHEYQQIVGKALMDWLKETFESEGYKAWINPQYSNGPDYRIWDEKHSWNNPLLVGEGKNWKTAPYMSLAEEDFRRVCNNLMAFRCIRQFVVSYFYNSIRRERIAQKCKTRKIHYVQLGYQLNPYWKDFTAKEREEYRIVSELPEATKKLVLEPLIRKSRLSMSKRLAKGPQFEVIRR